MIDGNAEENGDGGGDDLHSELHERIEIKAVVQNSRDHDTGRAEEQSAERFCVVGKIGKSKRCDNKRRKNGDAAQKRHGDRVHAPLVLRNVHRSDLVSQHPRKGRHGEGDTGRAQKGDENINQRAKIEFGKIHFSIPRFFR